MSSPLFIHKRPNDSNRKPVTRDCKDGLTYLQGFESMINRWIERDGRGNKISTDHTERNFIQLQESHWTSKLSTRRTWWTMCYLARFNPTESKDILAIYESSLAVTTGQV